MSSLLINGGRRLDGSVRVQGAKNSVLPILAATVLNGGENVIHDCPDLKDVKSSLDILESLGCKVKREGSTVIVDSTQITNNCIPEELMREMRSSVIFLGAIISRCTRAQITYPGGCELGSRPIDLHLKALRNMGIRISELHGQIYCDARGLHPASIHLDFPSVGATENIMLAAVFAKGTTKIVNAAKEPEIEDLQDFLNKAGAKITGAGTSEVFIEGVQRLKQVEHTVIPDRIVAATYLSAAAITGGKVEVTNAVPDHIASILAILGECGCGLDVSDGRIAIDAPARLHAIDKITTSPYPGFPTDAQAPVMSMLAVADGTSIITENIFENRFKHVEDLVRMGANIKVDGRVAVIRGVDKLYGAHVSACDLRGGAAMVVAALYAQGESTVDCIHHIDRGYERLEDRLGALGADISRID